LTLLHEDTITTPGVTRIACHRQREVGLKAGRGGGGTGGGRETGAKI
jgi:hypothetical protein